MPRYDKMIAIRITPMEREVNSYVARLVKANRYLSEEAARSAYGLFLEEARRMGERPKVIQERVTPELTMAQAQFRALYALVRSDPVTTQEEAAKIFKAIFSPV